MGYKQRFRARDHCPRTGTVQLVPQQEYAESQLASFSESLVSSGAIRAPGLVAPVVIVIGETAIVPYTNGMFDICAILRMSIQDTLRREVNLDQNTIFRPNCKARGSLTTLLIRPNWQPN